MDPESVSLGIVVAGLVAGVVDDAGQRLAVNAADLAGRLVERLRVSFDDVDDAEGARALARVEDAPDSPARLQALAEAIDRLAVDASVRAELEAVVNEASLAGVDSPLVWQTVQGDRNIIVGRTGMGATVKISYRDSSNLNDK